MDMRIFSGMRPTGRLHLGHLAGALTNWVALQEGNECFYSIVDWHALMSDYADPGRLSNNCVEILLDWLAVGLDPQKSAIFLQSHVKQHAELHLALSMIAPLGWLERNPTYKEQILNLQNKDLSTYGFLGYPVLQAADILIYKAEGVPVGEDQSAHLELSREVARRFNHFYGPVFPEPKTLLTKTAKLLGTDGRKMSKSLQNTLDIADTADVLWEKLRPMTTDTNRYRRTDPGDPDKCPVWDFHRFFNNDAEEMAELDAGCRGATIGCVDCKKKLFEHVKRVMEPISERRSALAADRARLFEILDDGARRARAVAEKTFEEVTSALHMLKI